MRSARHCRRYHFPQCVSNWKLAALAGRGLFFPRFSGKIQETFPKQTGNNPREHPDCCQEVKIEKGQIMEKVGAKKSGMAGHLICVWLKMKRSEGQTAGFGPCFHLPGQPISGTGFLSHSHMRLNHKGAALPHLRANLNSVAQVM